MLSTRKDYPRRDLNTLEVDREYFQKDSPQLYSSARSTRYPLSRPPHLRPIKSLSDTNKYSHFRLGKHSESERYSGHHGGHIQYYESESNIPFSPEVYGSEAPQRLVLQTHRNPMGVVTQNPVLAHRETDCVSRRLGTCGDRSLTKMEARSKEAPLSFIRDTNEHRERLIARQSLRYLESQFQHSNLTGS